MMMPCTVVPYSFAASWSLAYKPSGTVIDLKPFLGMVYYMPALSEIRFE